MHPICPTTTDCQNLEADQGTVMTTQTVNKHGEEIITSTTSIYETQTFKSQPNGESKLFRLPNLHLRTNHIFVLIGRHQRDGQAEHGATNPTMGTYRLITSECKCCCLINSFASTSWVFANTPTSLAERDIF